MKNLAIITLIGLFGLTSFVTTDVYSSWDRDAGMSEHPLMTFVYGYSQVEYSYAFPEVSSNHGVYMANDSGLHDPDWPVPIAAKCYVTFSSALLGDFIGGFDHTQTLSLEQGVDGGDTWEASVDFTFDLSRQPFQEITINAQSTLGVKVGHRGGGVWDAGDSWWASISEKFEHKEENLGVE